MYDFWRSKVKLDGKLYIECYHIPLSSCQTDSLKQCWWWWFIWTSLSYPPRKFTHLQFPGVYHSDNFESRHSLGVTSNAWKSTEIFYNLQYNIILWDNAPTFRSTQCDVTNVASASLRLCWLGRRDFVPPTEHVHRAQFLSAMCVVNSATVAADVTPNSDISYFRFTKRWKDDFVLCLEIYRTA